MSDIQYASADATIMCDTVRAEADVTMTMPSSSYPGQTITIVCGGSTVTLAPAASINNDDGANTSGDAAVLTCINAGGNWVVSGMTAGGAAATMA